MNEIEKLKYIKRKIKKIERCLIGYHCGKHVKVRKKIAELIDYLTIYGGAWQGK